MRSSSMPTFPTLFPKSSPSYSPEDLYSKLQAETPLRSKTDAMNSVIRAFSASKTLHHALGLCDPEPFVPPPAMASDLAKKFDAGLQEYGQLRAGDMFPRRQTDNLTTSLPSQQGKSILADILEEKESPVRTTSIYPTTADMGGELKVNVSTWSSGKQTVAMAHQYTFLDSDSDAANGTASEYADNDPDGEDVSLWKYGSSTTLAVSDCSRPGSAANSNETVPALSFPPRTSSLSSQSHYHGSNDTDLDTLQPISKNLPPGLRPISTHPIMPANSQHAETRAYSYDYSKPSTLRKTVSVAVLFPSPGVKQQVQDFKQADHGSVQKNVDSSAKGYHTFDDTSLDSKEDTSSSPTPGIIVQAPSQVKTPGSRKRAPSILTHNESVLPLSQRARRDDVAGLPVLSRDEEALWKVSFPGNTYALLTILLTWSHAMWTFHRRLPDSKLFSLNPAFLYPVSPPVRKRLLSVSLYDTSVEPHKEIRFLGPGDAAEMSYHEVDVFDDSESDTDSQASLGYNSPVDAIKQTLGLAAGEAPRHIRYMSMTQRAKTGEGRWCYVLVKSHKIENDGTPPHLVLAWHVSAVTATSDCLHTIYPDDATPKPTGASRGKLKRFSSLQNVGLALRSPAKFNFHHSLRSASSSSELPPVDVSLEIEQQGCATLHRTVLRMEKAGNIPLIEGYRIDVAAFRGWMDACGKGNGKVIMWRERDGG